jgi:hypothetical protein
MAPQIRHNEEHRRWAGAKIAALAQRMLAGEIGIAEGSGELAAWRFDVGADNDPDFIFFVGMDSETDDLPIGSARRHWNPEALRAKDAELAAYEAKVREEAFEICRRLIRRYEVQNS